MYSARKACKVRTRSPFSLQTQPTACVPCSTHPTDGFKGRLKKRSRRLFHLLCDKRLSEKFLLLMFRAFFFRRPATLESAATCSLPRGGGLGRGHLSNGGNLSQYPNRPYKSACRSDTRIRHFPARGKIHAPSRRCRSMPSYGSAVRFEQVSVGWVLTQQNLPNHPPCVGFSTQSTSAIPNFPNANRPRAQTRAGCC